jgi:prolipoprotein diacylglyceryltransferase
MIASIPSPSFNGVHLGPFDLRVYGLMYLLAVVAAVVITTRRWEAQGGIRELVQEVALWLGRHRRIRAPGLFALYVCGYSAFRIVEELLRVDPAHHIFGLRLNFFLAILLTVAGALWFLRTQRRASRAVAEPEARPSTPDARSST